MALIFLVICGAAAIAYPPFTSTSVMMLLGMILINSGVPTTINAFWTGTWGCIPDAHFDCVVE